MAPNPFDIITEADARVLPNGSTVRLARNGHITPLAADTLRAKRITVVRDDGVRCREQPAACGAPAPVR